jgi:hypothetical protein
LEMVETILSRPDISKEVKIVVEEVCAVLAIAARNAEWELTELGNICQSFDIRLVQNI